MQLLIDFSRPEDLRKKRRELLMALATIDSALLEIGKPSESPDQPSLPEIDPAVAESQIQGGAFVDVLTLVIPRLPTQFTMRDALVLAERERIPESRLRRSIDSLVSTNALELVQRGQGRRPASYRKVQ